LWKFSYSCCIRRLRVAMAYFLAVFFLKALSPSSLGPPGALEDELPW
jgi:hypothetical protein